MVAELAGLNEMRDGEESAEDNADATDDYICNA